MPIHLLSRFHFHPIGQGCFYTGNLRLYKQRDLEYNFVYDCGTSSKVRYLNKEVDSFKASLPHEHLDLLIISHFDADHVKGVARLLDGIHCSRVVIPYYDMIERLLLYTCTTEEDDDYRQFLLDPLGFFAGERFNIDEIIVIGESGEAGEDNILNPDDNPPKNKELAEIEKELEAEKLPFNANTVPFGDDSDPLVKRIKAQEGEDKDYSKVKLLKKPYRIDILIWEFFFYLKKYSDEVTMADFTNEVNRLMERLGIGMNGLFYPKNIEELKKIYRRFYGENLNSTSLVTYHGPTFNLSPYYDYWYSRHWYRFHEFMPENRFGTLLTGDIDISKNEDVETLTNYFRGYFDKVSFFQVPHHGSLRNWPMAIPNGLNNFYNYIVNHGIGRKHHPSANVVDYIKENCMPCTIHLNNEIYEFEYWFEIDA